MTLEQKVQRTAAFTANFVPASDELKVPFYAAEVERVATEYDVVQQLIENGVPQAEREKESHFRATMEDAIMAVRISLQSLLQPTLAVAPPGRVAASAVKLPPMSWLECRNSAVKMPPMPWQNVARHVSQHPTQIANAKRVCDDRLGGDHFASNDDTLSRCKLAIVCMFSLVT